MQKVTREAASSEFAKLECGQGIVGVEGEQQNFQFNTFRNRKPVSLRMTGDDAQAINNYQSRI